MNEDLKGEIIRKCIHLLVLAVPIGYNYLTSATVIPVLAILSLFSVFFDMMRVRVPGFNNWLVDKMTSVFRKHEVKNFTGSSFILFGALFSILIFSKNVALIVITFTVLGDVFAAIIGKRLGKHKLIGNSSLEGSSAFLVASFIGSLFITPYTIWQKLAGAFFATIIEMLPLKIDDNLTVPILTGTFMVLLGILAK